MLKVMDFKTLFEMAEEVVKGAEHEGAKVGATGAQKRSEAKRVLHEELAAKINDAVELPEMIESYTDDALEFAIEGAVSFFNRHAGQRWGTHLNLTQEEGRTRLALDFNF